MFNFSEREMKKFSYAKPEFFIILILLIMIFKSKAQDMPDPSEITHRPPTVAGAFYPEDPAELRAMIDEFIKKDISLPEGAEIKGIVVPHAGYVYSGWIAGRAYSQVQGRDYDAVVIISPSHRQAFRGSSVFNGEAYVTPLGTKYVDTDLAIEIAKGDNVNLSLDGHKWGGEMGEHAVEVQVPFLQVVLPEVPIVPIVMGSQDRRSIDDLMKAIVHAEKNTGRKILLVVSTDLSHYKTKNEARKLDRELVNTFGRYDYFKLNNELENREVEACGGGPLVTAMMAAEQMGANKTYPIIYGTSADSPNVKASGDKVVGYFSGLMLDWPGDDDIGLLPQFSLEDFDRIIKIAKEAVTAAVRGQAEAKSHFVPTEFGQEFAAFVTLKEKGQLRGCMGHTFATQSLVLEIREAGRMAATRDPRFKPVTEDELDDIDISVTILSRFQRVLDPEEIETGRDGIFLRSGKNSGLFLPQVATENNWDRDTFLQNLGKKAGLDTNAYKDPRAELYKFRAQVVGE